ncbi:hypothetical protein V8C42DRAFT_82647 [Trichoderma barbatum]
MSGLLSFGDDTKRFFQPSNRRRTLLPYSYCAPYGHSPDKAFFEEAERDEVDTSLEDLYGQQPMWFVPRQDWPPKPRKTIPYEQMNDRMIRSLYKDVSPPNGMTKDDWQIHVVQVHNFLVDSSQENWAVSDSLFAMLRIITRDLDRIVSIGHHQMTLPLPKRRRPGAEEALAHGFSGLLPDASAFREVTRGKRLFATLAFISHHWVSIIWDRRYGQLYYFDSWENERAERIKVMTRAWKRLLQLNDYPDAFDLCVAPYTNQPGSGECGYLALFGLLTTLRGLAGCQVDERMSGGQHGTGLAFIPPDAQPPRRLPFDLRIRDWCLYSPEVTTVEGYMRIVYSTLEAIAGNELGVVQLDNIPPRMRNPHRWSLAPVWGKLVTRGGWEVLTSSISLHNGSGTGLGGWSPLDYDLQATGPYPTGLRTFPSSGSSIDHEEAVTQPPPLPVYSGNTSPSRGQWQPPTPSEIFPIDYADMGNISDFSPDTSTCVTPQARPQKQNFAPGQRQGDSPASRTTASRTTASQTRGIAGESSLRELSEAPLEVGGLYRELPDGGRCEYERMSRIEGVVIVGNVYNRSSDLAGLERLGPAGGRMTLDVAKSWQVMKPESVRYIRYSNSYCTLMPPGLMDERVWGVARQEVEEARRPPATTSSTRAQRAAARNARLREQPNRR